MSKFVGITALVAATISLLPATAFAQTFRLGHHHAVGGAVDKAAKHFAALVNEKSGKRITVRVFPAAQLGQEREAYDLVNQGAIDISITSTAILDKVFPPIAVTSLPFVFRDWDHARTAYKGEFGKALTDGVREASDTEILGFIHLGFRDLLFTGEPPATLADMKGKRMRSPENTVWIRMFELMGSRPTPVTWGEVYTSMQTGVAEGLDSPPATALDMKFNEVTKSLVKTGHMFGSMIFAMNENKFKGLKPEDQALMKAAAVETGDWSDTEIAMPEEKSAYDRLTKAGVKVVEAPKIEEWRAAMAPLRDEVATRNRGADRFIKMLVSEQ
ncbi:TRAP transporter substrate-binding protein [Microvirga sp. BT689]|uniref:TRAP transporter substrate-binding protein n=1 Tax=Microvirga arvi TaxID=2778731 RepID=UPI0019511C14|nr:TRAP transporter substrate-binding protein [Microvirga arvi]MBM6581200.1 TRAP transporter substrate-binding protein [Microvirga arvi]